MWEEVVFVAEGSGYDLHWDLKFDCLDKLRMVLGRGAEEIEWSRGDFLYVPPFTMHQHFNAGDGRRGSSSSAIASCGTMGFDWLDQVEHALGF